MDVPSSVQSCGGIRIRLTCIIPYKSCPLFALCSDPTNCRLCPSTFLISGKVLFSLLIPPSSLSPAVLPGLGMCRCFTELITTYTLNAVRWLSVLIHPCCCCSAGARREGGNLSLWVLFSSEMVKFNPDCQNVMMVTQSIKYLSMQVTYCPTFIELKWEIIRSELYPTQMWKTI